MLWELLQYGIRVYYQPPPFVHSKLLVIDEQYSLVGSANIDARSLRLNFELNVEVYDHAFAGELARHFEAVLAGSKPTALDDVDRRPLPMRLVDGVAWLFSPYL
jgi:cardiolipin synthase